MSEFISYSRIDTPFVRQLHEQLVASKRDIWVDWEDIPLTADWWQEIQRGISSANAFIFVISPDSVKSPVCRDEINYAVDNNKRIVPILHRELVADDDKAMLHPVISSHNWIFLRDQDDFDAAFTNLIGSLDMDLEHVHEHTRLLVRALEWDAEGRNPSNLLNGSEITKAEAWLTGGMNLQPEPTDLQTQYILASRKAATARSRRTLAGVTVALIVAIALAIVSLFLFQLSETRRMESDRLRTVAEDKSNEARSLALAANARNLIRDHNNNLGLSLAIAAYQAHNPARPDVQQTLAGAVYGPGARFRLQDQEKSVLDVAISADVQTGYSVSSDGSLDIWDLDSGAVKQHITFDGQVPNNVALSPDGTALAVSLFDNSIHLLDVGNGDTIRTLTGHEDLIMQLAFSPDGTKLLSGGLDRTLRLWDVATGEQVLKIDSPGAILNLAFAPNGLRAVSSSGDDVLTGSEADHVIDRTVRVWDMTTGEELAKFEPNSGFVRAVAFSPDGRRIVAGTWNSASGGRLHLWRISTGELEHVFFGHTDIISSVAFSPDGTQIISASWDRTLRIWDIATGLEVQSFHGHRDRILSMAVSANGEYVLTGTGNAGNDVPDPTIDLASDPAVWLWDLKSRAQIRSLEGHEDWVWSVALSPDDTLAATSSGPLRLPANDTSVRIWDVATGEQIRKFDGHTNTVQSVAFSPDGKSVASASWDGTVRIWNVETGAGRIAYAGHTDKVLSVIFSHDGQTAFSTSADKTIQMWDVATGTEIKRFEGHTGAVNAVALSPDGTMLLSASDDRTVRLWNIDTGEEIRQFIGHADRVNNVAFSPDGTQALSTSWDSTVRLWDVATGEQIRQLVGHNGAVWGVAFSKDGRAALTSSSDLTIRLWDLDTGQEIRRYEGHTNWVLSVVFSHDDSFALSGGEDNTARLWRVETSLDALIAWGRANRYIPELSCAEREQYNVEPFCNEDGLVPAA